MDNFVIPPSPNWYNSHILACASDNTLVYGSKNEVVIIHPTIGDESPKIDILPDDGSNHKIVSVDVNPKWNSPNKWILSSWDDKLVKIWDMKLLQWKKCSPPYKGEKDNLVAAMFLSEERMLSVTEAGILVICNIHQLKFTHINHLFSYKLSITCMAPCPHSSNIVALGAKTGLIIVIDLKKNGHITHTLRGHYEDVTSLSWCPAPVNIFPEKPASLLLSKNRKNNTDTENDTISKMKKDDNLNGAPNNEDVEEKNHLLKKKEDLLREVERRLAESISENSKQGQDLENKPCESGEPIIYEPQKEFSVSCEVVEKPKIEDSYVKLKNSTSEEIESIMGKTKKDLSGSCVPIKPFIDETEKKNEICEAGESVIEKLDEKVSTSCETVEPLVEEPKKEVSTSFETVESVVEEPKKEVSTSCETVESVVEEPKKEVSTSCETVESVVEEPKKEVSTSCVTVEPMLEKSEKELSASSEPVGVKEEPKKELPASCETVEVVADEPEIELSASSKPFEPLKEEQIKELPDSCEHIEPLNEKLLETPTTSCNEVVKKTHTKTVEMNGNVPQRDLMLASCSKDRKIIIWRARDDGKTLCSFKLSDKKPYFNRNKKNSSPSWRTLKWVNPFYFLITTNKGEVLKYHLPDQPNAQKEYTLVHNEHVGFIFALAAHVPILTVDNWFADHEVKFWTFSHDMYLLNTILNSRTNHLLSIETFCALVNCMTWCPMDPNRIALGLSNGSIKIWNTNSSSPKFFTPSNYSAKIYGKITNLEWNPKNELLIAFSTEEGTIGIINTNNKQRATWFKQYFSSAIHNIQWAPYKDKTCLYVLGKGNLMIFDADQPKEDPLKILIKLDIVPYYFSWKLDMSLMLVSHACGEIAFLDSNLEIKASYYNTKKMSLIKWHPDSEKSCSARSFWVAAALENVVYLFDFAEVAENNGTLNIDEAMKRKIELHYSTVKEIAWNPFNGDQLVTAGDDGMAYVLNATDGTILASYYDRNRRFQPIKAIMWSPVEEDLLIMAVSRTATLIGWKSKDNIGAPSSEVLKECQDHLKNIKKSNGSPKEFDASKKILKAAKYVILPSITGTPNEKDEDSARFLFEILDETVYNRTIDNPSNIQKLFGKKDDILLLLNSTEKTHLDKGRLESAATVSVFKGDLQIHIIEAIQQRRVTPLLISLAPSVSTSLWQKACETYASQLSSRSDADPLEVVLYFLSSQKIEEAIEYLCEKEMFKEALALVKSRLPSDSVIIKDIIKRWAKYCAQCGNLEIAAICYIKLGKYEEAVKLLMRRNDVGILGFAYDLAEITENTSLKKFCRFRYNAFSKNDRIDIEKSNKLLEEDGDENNTKEGIQEKIVNGDVKINGKECNVDEVIHSETKNEEPIEINNSVDIEAVTSTHDEVNDEKKITRKENTNINGEESVEDVKHSKIKIEEVVEISNSVDQEAVTSTHNKVNEEKLTEINDEERIGEIIQSETKIEEVIEIKNSVDKEAVTITHDELNKEKQHAKNGHTEVNDEEKIVEMIKQSQTMTEEAVEINNTLDTPTLDEAKNTHEVNESEGES
ncbi:uncharacterized protein LOC123684241 isoform X2 [Harmonia axyridis]|uniref:uncharacterized protein LOC123684241 isoform X2 n=1 Tax=Harmonia axyridis TaxID=115357 RepID=UPI001E27697E|nr:uncharacterized protein LOC123684241 isoform X2 [Harmonia axyridis]